MSQSTQVISNGIISVYVDTVLFKEVDKKTDIYGITMTAGEDHRLRVAFRPKIRSQASRAQIEVQVSNADTHTDQCMGVKDCLKVFGDDSDAGFKLRNNNTLQLRCLGGGLQRRSDALTAKCEEWRACLPAEEKRRLKTFLRASLVIQGLSMIEGGKVMAQGSARRQHVGRACFDPAIADQESWDCDCYEDMINACGGLDEQCIKDHMCKIPEVCMSWKAQQCSSALITAPKQMKKRRGNRGGASLSAVEAKRRSLQSGSSSEGSDVESTLKGKCAV